MNIYIGSDKKNEQSFGGQSVCFKCSAVVYFSKSSYARFIGMTKCKAICETCFKIRNIKGKIQHPNHPELKEIRQRVPCFDEVHFRNVVKKINKIIGEKT